MGFWGTNFFRNPLSDGLDPTTQAILELRKATEDLASRDIIFVNETGAMGDDITDDTAAIQAALDSGRTNVFFPPSFFYFLLLDIPRTSVRGIFVERAAKQKTPRFIVNRGKNIHF